MPKLERFRGTINATEIRKVPKIYQSDISVGAYESIDGNTYSSKFAIWVPKPRNGEHTAGIFIRLSNPNGSAYSRLTPTEFADLYSFLRSELDPAQHARSRAQHLIDIYRSAEKQLFEESLKFDNIETIL